MLRHNLRIALRSLQRNKAFAAINIAGLSVGMAVAMLIGLWLHDELVYNRSHLHYDRIARVVFSTNYNNDRINLAYNPPGMGPELRRTYGDNFKYVVMSTFPSGHVLSLGTKKVNKTGNYMDADAPELLSLHMLKGTRAGLQDPASILLSASLAKTFFGNVDPMGTTILLDNFHGVKVTGVYEDIPYNSDFKDLGFIAPWKLFLMMNPGLESPQAFWLNNNFQTFVQLNEHADINAVSAKIKDIRIDKIPKENARILKPQTFLHPMSRWHLYTGFTDEGVPVQKKIQYIWLLGIVGLFVLLLACINFMNLSTARSERRVKEVGIRKTIGSLRSQLIRQFFGESFLATILSFALTLIIIRIILPAFNGIADKQLSIPWANPFFWLACLGFIFFTALVAGIYPALYLSSFQPIRALKGGFRAGRLAVIPRKVLVVLQFTVSIVLIIGTIVVYRQIQLAQNRPIGYNRDGLIMIDMTGDIQQHFNAIRDELKSAGAITEMGASVNTTTEFNADDGQFSWRGKDPNFAVDFAISNVTSAYGKTIGWQIIEGRDFSPAYPTDSSAFILNETVAKIIGFQHPVGATIQWNGKPFHIIGVTKDIVFESPYQTVSPSIFYLSGNQNLAVTLKINPTRSTASALAEIGSVFDKYNPSYPFDYRFVDLEYAKKFKDESRIGKLAGVFAALAIFISCLGLFGMAAFMAEQRTKEIGVRKILGASLFNLLKLLSIDFLSLVLISILLAVPVAWYVMHNWLGNYRYRAEISWWIFVLAGSTALVISILTIGYQTIRAALRNPVHSLRAE